MRKTYQNWTGEMIPVTFEGGTTHYLLPRQKVESDREPLRLDSRITVTEEVLREVRKESKERKYSHKAQPVENVEENSDTHSF